ncbi:MAG: OadG family protein [Gammaproteobacteria bacterium]
MNPLLSQGIELMLVGMGVVFVFLVMLVGAVTLMSQLVARFAPDAPLAVTPRGPVAAPAGPGVDDRTLAVIHEAVRRHRGQA